jgi:AcrR family transcriptional regulator
MDTTDPRIRRSRAAIMDSALELFVEHGANGVTVEAVSQKSGVAKTTIYRHWASRDDLLADVFRQFDHALAKPEPDQTALEVLQAQAGDLTRTLSRPDWQRALPSLLDVARRSAEFAALHDTMAPGSGSMSAAISRAMDEGLFPGAEHAGEIMVQIVGPLTLAAIFAPETLTPNFASDLVIRLVRGYGGPPS